MFLVFIICMLGSTVCSSVVLDRAQNASSLQESRGSALLISTLGMALGFFLLQYVRFNTEFYDSTKYDFMDYGKLTGQGWMHILMGTGGLIAVAENVLAIVKVFVEEIKQTISSKQA